LRALRHGIEIKQVVAAGASSQRQQADWFGGKQRAVCVSRAHGWFCHEAAVDGWPIAGGKGLGSFRLRDELLTASATGTRHPAVCDEHGAVPVPEKKTGGAALDCIPSGSGNPAQTWGFRMTLPRLKRTRRRTDI
jgi:hypothetical protein